MGRLQQGVGCFSVVESKMGTKVEMVVRPAFIHLSD